MATKDTFCQDMVFRFDHQNLTIALPLVSSFTNGSFFFMENVNPIKIKYIWNKRKKVVVTISAKFQSE